MYTKHRHKLRPRQEGMVRYSSRPMPALWLYSPSPPYYITISPPPYPPWVEGEWHLISKKMRKKICVFKITWWRNLGQVYSVCTESVVGHLPSYFIFFSFQGWAGINAVSESSNHSVHIEWHLPLSGEYYIMMKKLAQAGEVGVVQCASPYTIQYLPSRTKL